MTQGRLCSYLQKLILVEPLKGLSELDEPIFKQYSTCIPPDKTSDFLIFSGDIEVELWFTMA